MTTAALPALAGALQVPCAFCGAAPGSGCIPGLHMDRVATAYRNHLVPGEDVRAVIYAVTVFTWGTVIPADIPAGAS